MKHIFYFITIFPLIWEMSTVLNIKKYHKFYKSFKGKKFDNYNGNQKAVGILTLGYILWSFIGLFTFQWMVFVVFILMSFIPKKFIILRWIDAFLSVLILLFIIINAYHFKIDFWQLFKP